MKREDLEEMSKADLREHAEVKGVALEDSDTKGAMIEKILGEYVKAKQAKKLPNEKLPPIGRLTTLQGEPVNGKKYRLTIFATEADKGDVDLIINGHNIRVQRGKEVVVDEAYINVLQNAVIDTVVQDPDTGERMPTRMLVYPHQAIAL